MALQASVIEFHEAFQQVDDPRIDRHQAHALIDILFLSVAAVLAGADGPSDVADFAKQKLEWCRRFVPLINGPPSHDTIGRVLSLIKPQQFQQAFLEWIVAFVDSAGDTDVEQYLAIDGKTACNSHDAQKRLRPLHLVSAWASSLGLTLGQVACEEKSNEITAIPRLLELLELKGAIVSIDAMGCQTEIAKDIVTRGGDYVLAVKDNQPKLAAGIQKFFETHHEQNDLRDHGVRQHRTTERSRGRDEERQYFFAPLPAEMKTFTREWTNLRSIGQVINLTTHDGEQTSEVRYFISSRPPRVHEFATAVRRHWSIESLHWVLDVVFGEDESRLRKGHATENFSCLRKFAVSLLKQDTSPGSLKGKRKRAAWNTDFLEKLLFFK